MSRSYRNIAIALGLIFITLPALSQEHNKSTLKSQPVTEPRQKERSPESNSKTDSESNNSIHYSPTLMDIESAIRELISEENQIESKRKKEQEVRDLNAQEDMAFWAKLMFWASVCGIILSTAGLLLIRRTLIYTRDTLKEAGATNNAAWHTVELARDSAEREQRAYVTVKSVHYIKKNQEFFKNNFMVEVSNGGSTPAMELVIHAEGRFVANPVLRSKIVIAPVPNNTPKTVIGPNGYFSRDFAIPKTAIPEVGPVFVVSGKVEYKDVFKRKRTTRFAYLMPIELYKSGRSPISLIPCHHSNTAN